MKIGFDTIRKIARRSPTLTLADFVSVWTEMSAEKKRDRDNERYEKKRKPSGNEAEIGGNGAETERKDADVFALGREVLGPRSGGMVQRLIDAKGPDMDEVRKVLDQAKGVANPRGYIAACTRKQDARNDTMAAFDRLIARTASDEGEADPPMRDITP